MGVPAQTTLDASGSAADLPPALRGRLGLDIPREHWPTVPRLKALEAAGFAWLQVHCPPKAMLADADATAYHASALRAVLEPTDLRLVLHAPDDLAPTTDRRALAGLAAHVNCAGAEVVVVHGAVAPPEHRDREARALRELAGAIAPAAVALENTAATYPGHAKPAHDPAEILRLIDVVGAPNVNPCLDVGHAHLHATGKRRQGRAGADLAHLIAPSLARAALVHVHDNLGAHRPRDRAPRLVPLRLDLHLPPGAGAIPWPAIAPQLLDTGAPLLLELHPPHRPEPGSLATITAELLTRTA